MFAEFKPKKIQIYENPTGKSMQKIKEETGCTIIINAGTFDSLTKPNPILKVDGKIKASAIYTDWGMSWNEASDCSMESALGKKNFISCVGLITPWSTATTSISYPSDRAGRRERTVWGITKQGTHVVLVDTYGRTPEEVRSFLCSKFEFSSMLLLDGGTSTQGIIGNEEVKGGRKVANYILFWCDNYKLDNTPYGNFKKGCTGSAVRWLQNKLNLMHFKLEADGDFGSKTETAVIKFQVAWGLTADGVVGEKTIEALKEVESLITNTSTDPDRLVSKAISCIGITEPNDDDELIKRFNEATSSNLGYNSAWCQVFVWNCGAYYNIPIPSTASCTAARVKYINEGTWRDASYTPKKGDLVYFDWDGSGDCDHVEIVLSVINNIIYTIAGNVAVNGTDRVARMQRKLGNMIVGFATPYNPVIKKQTYTIKFTDKSDAETFVKQNKKYFPSMEVVLNEV